MKKLLTIVTLLGLTWGGGSCTDSNTDEEQAILIPQEALSATIAADSGLKHTVSFETTGEWQASVESPGSGDTWITLSPTFGNAGKNTITATLTENIQPTSRKSRHHHSLRHRIGRHHHHPTGYRYERGTCKTGTSRNLARKPADLHRSFGE